MKKFLAIMAPLAVGLIFAASAVDAKTCKSKTVKVTTSNLPGTVTDQAKNMWGAKVAKKYGVQYSVWPIAKSKSVKCNKPIFGMQTCTVKAKPCKP